MNQAIAKNLATFAFLELMIWGAAAISTEIGWGAAVGITLMVGLWLYIEPPFEPVKRLEAREEPKELEKKCKPKKSSKPKELEKKSKPKELDKEAKARKEGQKIIDRLVREGARAEDHPQHGVLVGLEERLAEMDEAVRLRRLTKIQEEATAWLEEPRDGLLETNRRYQESLARVELAIETDRIMRRSEF